MYSDIEPRDILRTASQTQIRDQADVKKEKFSRYKRRFRSLLNQEFKERLKRI